MAWKPVLPDRSFWLVCAVVLALTGCGEQEQIRHYLAPKESLPEPPAVRMLAVMVPHDKDVWFFKFLGAKKAVSEHEADFNGVLSTVRFKDQGDARITWVNPPGWKRQSGPRPRFATLRLGAKGEGLEISITKFGPESSDVRENVDRWRGQLGLPRLTDEEFDKLRNNTEVDGVKATRVDLVGILKPEAAPRRGRPAQEQPAKDRLPFHYATPDGWEAQPPVVRQGIRIPVVFRIADKGSEAEAAALPSGGGLEPNVNRWRRQVGLPPLAEEQIRREALSLKVSGQEVVYVDLSGPGLGAPKRILGAIVPLGGETWFFTLKGPPDLVGKEQAHFEAFVSSVRFVGQAGAAHE